MHNNIPTALQPDKDGFYSNAHFGGAFVPEEVIVNLREVDAAFEEAIADSAFMERYRTLLRTYVGRPSPLFHAERLSGLYGTNIYLKREDLNHTGAHKINNALALGMLAQRMGKKRIIAETGAGQHGVATATVCALLGLECTIYMGAVDCARQHPNVQRMEMLGAKVVPVEQGTSTLQDAVDAALMNWVERRHDTFYLIGSAVGPYPFPKIVTYFQSIISEELLMQVPEETGHALPTAVIACVGGGSNAGGAFYHFVDKPSVRLVAVEAAGHGVDTREHAATMTKGVEKVLHGSRTYVIDGEPYSISAGLDYPGVGPIMAALAHEHRMEVLAATDDEALAAAHRLARLEGIIPALESSHALAALDKLKFAPSDIVVVNISGRGDKDMLAFSRPS